MGIFERAREAAINNIAARQIKEEQRLSEANAEKAESKAYFDRSMEKLIPTLEEITEKMCELDYHCTIRSPEIKEDTAEVTVAFEWEHDSDRTFILAIKFVGRTQAKVRVSQKLLDSDLKETTLYSHTPFFARSVDQLFNNLEKRLQEAIAEILEQGNPL